MGPRYYLRFSHSILSCIARGETSDVSGVIGVGGGGSVLWRGFGTVSGSCAPGLRVLIRVAV
jgi:hypothetical protein